MEYESRGGAQFLAKETPYKTTKGDDYFSLRFRIFCTIALTAPARTCSLVPQSRAVRVTLKATKSVVGWVFILAISPTSCHTGGRRNAQTTASRFVDSGCLVS